MVIGILPYVKTTSPRPDAYLYMEENVSSDMLRLRRSPAKVKERCCERISCIIEGVCSVGLCISFSNRESPLCVKKRKLGSEHAVKFSKVTWHQIEILERRVHRRELSTSVNLMSVVLASRMGFGANIYNLQNADKTTYYSPP